MKSKAEPTVKTIKTKKTDSNLSKINKRIGRLVAQTESQEMDDCEIALFRLLKKRFPNESDSELFDVVDKYHFRLGFIIQLLKDDLVKSQDKFIQEQNNTSFWKVQADFWQNQTKFHQDHRDPKSEPEKTNTKKSGFIPNRGLYIVRD